MACRGKSSRKHDEFYSTLKVDRCYFYLPYGFNVGQSERVNVLKGLDLGVGGMRVGGQQLLIVPSELTYGNKGVDIEVLKTEHVSSEMQIEFAQEVDIMSLKEYRSFASNWSILTRALLCFFRERNRRFSCKGI